MVEMNFPFCTGQILTPKFTSDYILGDHEGASIGLMPYLNHQTVFTITLPLLPATPLQFP